MKPTFEVFYDGACPLCRREIDLVRRLDRRERVRFTDISSSGFDPTFLGRTREEMMARIHGRKADGSLIEGVEVFRQLYAAVGLGIVVAVTRLPPLSWALDRAYTWFAKNRLRLTGRVECTEKSCRAFAP